MAKKARKNLKIVGYIVLVILILTVIGGFIGMRKFNDSFFNLSPNHLVYSSESKPIYFDWANDSIGDYFETQVAITIPVKLEGLAHKFYFQFDTGAPTTIIYGTTLASLQKIKADFKTSTKGKTRYLEGLDMLLGENRVNASTLSILEDYGDSFDKNDTIKPINLGTLGANFMDKKITVIDFKNQYLQVYDNRPEWMTSLSGFKPFDFRGRRFMLPARIKGKDLELFYDSGASTFGLITTKNRYDSYTNEAQEEVRYNANKFGDPVPICHRRTSTKIEIGNANLNLKRISYVDMYAKFQGLMTPFTRIGGWLGNRPFDQNTVIFDTKKEEFIVIESSIRK